MISKFYLHYTVGAWILFLITTSTRTFRFHHKWYMPPHFMVPRKLSPPPPTNSWCQTDTKCFISMRWTYWWHWLTKSLANNGYISASGECFNDFHLPFATNEVWILIYLSIPTYWYGIFRFNFDRVLEIYCLGVVRS